MKWDETMFKVTTTQINYNIHKSSRVVQNTTVVPCNETSQFAGLDPDDYAANIPISYCIKEPLLIQG